MQLRLGDREVHILKATLRRGGLRETGGQLFGQMHAPGDFSVTEVTTQRRMGTVGRFFVDVAESLRAAARFFTRTGRSYKTFNYIGEWHSHPSYPTRPSSTDVATMQDLVRADAFRGHFAVLLIVRLDGDVLAAGACVFDRTGAMFNVQLEFLP
jgi:[CysO sulfur-carrier protein]-S-L-cysteine hydrolase